MSGILGTFNVVFWGVITFSILVVLHEGGHFLAARAFGVKVHEFMIGLPGPAIRLHTKNMAWGITAIPLGGYVRIAGMEPGAEDELLGPALAAVVTAGRLDAAGLSRVLEVPRDRATALLTTLEDWAAITPVDELAYEAASHIDRDLPAAEMLAGARAITYRGLKTWKRIVVLVSGVAVNLLTAILTFTIVLSAFGAYRASQTFGTVEAGSPAALAGLKVGDRLESLNGTTIGSWDEFLTLMGKTKTGQTVTLGITRDGHALTVTATLTEKDGHGFLGVAPSAEKYRYPVLKAAGEAFTFTGMVFAAIVNFFRPATFAQSVASSRGVVGISVMAADAAKAGPLDYAWLIALLSLSLGAMNILPIPPLDGGKVAVELIERVAGRPLGRRFSIAVSAAGALLLFSLIGYLMYADVMRLVR